MPGLGEMDEDSIKGDNDEIDMINSELSGEMLPLSMRQGMVDKLKKLSVAPSHLDSYLKSEH